MQFDAEATEEQSGSIDETRPQPRRPSRTEAVFDTLHRHAVARFAARGFTIWLVENAKLVEQYRDEDSPQGLDEPAAQAVREHRDLLIEPETASAPATLFVPLMMGNRVLGVMSMQSGAKTLRDAQERHILRTICGCAAIVLDTMKDYRRLAHHANHDALTGLVNRRYFLEAANHEIQRCRRNGRVCSVVMVDLDHFKAINDTHGHVAGDKMLRIVADCLRSHLRAGDMAARFGGDELMIFLPETDLDGAAHVAERLRRALDQLKVREGKTLIETTASLGVAQWQDFEDSIEPAIERADSALYFAKRAGRNLVGRSGRSE